MQLLNIPTSPEQLEAWRSFLAPERQPFLLTTAEAQGYTSVSRKDAGFDSQDQDTYALWNIDRAVDRVVWFTQDEWSELPLLEQRRLLRLQVRYGRSNVPLGRHFQDVLPDLPPGRFLWSREQLTPKVLARLISKDQKPCQRDQVPQAVWDAAEAVLPRVHELAGTFPANSIGNCFGAVMGAAGVAGAEDEWMQREPFEDFLRTRTQRGGRDDLPGVVLVWRSERGVEHAAVALGAGWGFHKPSQSWQTARVVLPIDSLKRNYRTPGHRLERYQVIP